MNNFWWTSSSNAKPLRMFTTWGGSRHYDATWKCSIDMYTLQPLPQDRRWIDAAVRMHFTLFGRKEEKRESRSPYFECRNSPSPLIVSRRLRHCFNTNDSWLFEADDATHLYRSGHQLPMTARRRLHYPYREPIHLVAMSWSVLSFILSSLYFVVKLDCYTTNFSIVYIILG